MMPEVWWRLGLVVVCLGLVSGLAIAEPAPSGFVVVGDAIEKPLDGLVGDPVRGRRVVLDRESGNCLICHSVPEPREPAPGDIGPNLAGVGSRLSAGQIRLRLVDASKLNPHTIMPPYHRVADLTRVATRFRDKPVFTAQEIEDVVAWLTTLQ